MQYPNGIYWSTRKKCNDRPAAPARNIRRTRTRQQRRWSQRREAVEPVIGHLKSDLRMVRCRLQGASGDALHAVLCAAGYDLHWLLWVMAWIGLRAL
ncbi:MAG: transposase [Rhodocyclaceae bacterium]|nr:transposase [Rhodocyclaceae bacterium]